MTKKLLLSLGLLFFCANAVQGQMFIYSYGGREVKGTVVDSLNSEPVIGAVVSLISESWGDEKISVKNFSTDKKGEFSMNESLGKQARLEISSIGYKVKTVPLDARSRNSILLGKIRLSPDIQEIDKLVVTARQEMFRIKGDTTLYFPKAVNTMQGDMAIDILRSMPGVNVLDSGEIVIGQDTVKRAYVNNKLIFGEDARTALKYLEADQVSLIQAYEETDEESEIELGKENAKKRKVINLLTFDDFDTSVTATARAAFGSDFHRDMDGRRQMRYSALIDANLFNERRQVSLSANARNMQGGSIIQGDFYTIGGVNFSFSPGSGYRSVEDIDLTATFKSKNLKHEYGGGYSFDHSVSRSRSISQNDYFPTQEYRSRMISDTTASRSTGSGHTLTATYNYKDTEAGTSGSLSASGSYSENNSLTNRSSHSVLEGLPLNHIRSSSDRSGESLSASVRGNFRKRKGDHSINANANLNISDGNSNDIDVEDDIISATKRYIMGDGESKSISAGGAAGYSYTMKDKGSLGLRYSISYRNSRNHILAIDTLAHVIDSARTRTQTINNLSNSLSASYDYNSDKHNLGVSLRYGNTYMMRDDRFPEVESIERRFNSLTPSVNYNYKGGKLIINSYLSYNNSTPSVEMFSDRLDVSNPLWLRGGNPNLKRSGDLQLIFGMYYTAKAEKIFNLFILAHRLDNNIVSNQRFFVEDTYLPEYNYTAPRGSTLNTYTNAGSYYDFSIYPSFSMPIRFIKSKFEIGGGYGFRNPEEGVEGRIVRTESHSGDFNISLRSNFSSNIRINLSSNTSYVHSRNYTGNIDHYISENLSADLQIDLFQRVSLQVAYNYNYSINSSYPGNALRGHVLNASIQCRIFKNRMGIISLNAYDILNNNSVYASRVLADYINTSWQQAYSSYFTLAFEYKFNKTN